MKYKWLMPINLYAILVQMGAEELAEQAYADCCGWGINGKSIWALDVN